MAMERAKPQPEIFVSLNMYFLMGRIVIMHDVLKTSDMVNRVPKTTVPSD
jgi:hypothetical protein